MSQIIESDTKRISYLTWLCLNCGKSIDLPYRYGDLTHKTRIFYCVHCKSTTEHK